MALYTFKDSLIITFCSQVQFEVQRLRKAASAVAQRLEILEKLEFPRTISTKVLPIPIRDASSLSPEEFDTLFSAPRIPCIIRGGSDICFPGRSKGKKRWTLGSIVSTLGRCRQIPLCRQVSASMRCEICCL